MCLCVYESGKLLLTELIDVVTRIPTDKYNINTKSECPQFLRCKVTQFIEVDYYYRIYYIYIYISPIFHLLQ